MKIRNWKNDLDVSQFDVGMRQPHQPHLKRKGSGGKSDGNKMKLINGSLCVAELNGKVGGGGASDLWKNLPGTKIYGGTTRGA